MLTIPASSLEWAETGEGFAFDGATLGALLLIVKLLLLAIPCAIYLGKRVGVRRLQASIQKLLEPRRQQRLALESPVLTPPMANAGRRRLVRPSRR
jgi:hypothetical protein